jgi:hypothetical protein
MAEDGIPLGGPDPRTRADQKCARGEVAVVELLERVLPYDVSCGS